MMDLYQALWETANLEGHFMALVLSLSQQHANPCYQLGAEMISMTGEFPRTLFVSWILPFNKFKPPWSTMSDLLSRSLFL